MPKRCCENCVYATRLWGRWLRIIMASWSGLRVCFNSAQSPGRMQEVYPAGSCRNWQPRRSPPLRIQPPEPPDDSIRYIPLTKGQYAIVDAEDYDRLSRYKWYGTGFGDKMYAARHHKGKTIYMHRVIMKVPKGKVVDHVNGHRLNNRKCNLRVCTHQENLCNRAGLGEFIGVDRDKKSGKYRALVHKNRRSFRAGPFATAIEAARARDRLALEHHGQYAWLNFPDEWPPEKRQALYAEAKAASRKSRARPQTRKPDKQKGRRSTTKVTKTMKKARKSSTPTENRPLLS
jgi:hypothetical protein